MDYRIADTLGPNEANWKRILNHLPPNPPQFADIAETDLLGYGATAERGVRRGVQGVQGMMRHSRRGERWLVPLN